MKLAAAHPWPDTSETQRETSSDDNYFDKHRHPFHGDPATYSTVIRPVCHDGLRGNLKLPILLVLSAKGEGVGKVANEEDRRCIAA